MKPPAEQMLEFLHKELNECENYTSGLGSCYEDPKRQEGGSYICESVCTACMIDRFLKTGHVPRKPSLIEICDEVMIHYV